MRLRPKGAANSDPKKRHSSIDCQEDYLKANSSGSL